MKSRKFKLLIALLIIALVIGGVFYFYITNVSIETSEGQTAMLAEEAVVDANITSLSKQCFSENVTATSTDTVTFDIRKVHNTTCGGDPQTAPRITTALVNTLTRKVILEN